jgi:predicted metal-binding membrane protein
LRQAVGTQPALLTGLVVVVVWQASPVKQRFLNHCHRRPALAAFGRAADLAALRFGTSLALWCIGSCWALMLLPLLVPGHALPLMAAVALWLWAERVEPVAPARWRLRGPVTALRIGIGQTASWAHRAPGLRSRA